MKKTNLSELKNGAVFKYGGLSWIKLDEAGGAVKALAESIVEERAFDEDNNNDWETSSLRRYLNDNLLNDLIDLGADKNAFIEFESDLTSDDGLKDYGTTIDKIALISCDDYRKYRSLITPADDWWWTITPYSTSASDSCSARSVHSSGVLSYSSACNGGSGVRPLCNLKSDILVSIEDTEFESKLDNAIKHCEDVINRLDDNCDCKKEHEFLLEILLERKEKQNG